MVRKCIKCECSNTKTVDRWACGDLVHESALKIHKLDRECLSIKILNILFKT